MLTWGSEEASMRSMEAESGIDSPSLAKKPKLSPLLVWYYDEFNQVAHDRNLASGHPCPITTGQISEYCDFFNIDYREEFFFYIRMIDRLYLTEHYKRKKSE
jgi:hypothetical protein